MSNDEIVQELERMDKESLGLKEELIRITWWMRGGINLDQAWNLSLKERQMIGNLIKENMETSKKTGTPIF
jgi:hypothetical protein